MKRHISIVLFCLLLCLKTFGQDLNYPVNESRKIDQNQKQKGKTALLKTNLATSAAMGPQDLVLLFVDYPEGRIQPGNILPTTDADTMYFHNVGNDSVFDAIGGMSTVRKDPDDPDSPMRKKIRKYTYDDYWDMFFSVGTYYGAVHPDSASHGILAYGSFRDYFREVSYGKMDIVPYQTKPGISDKYNTGIVNAIDEADGKKYVRWIMMPNRKSSYRYEGDVKTPYHRNDIDPVLRDLFNQGQISFDVDNYHGKMIIVGAGSCSGGMNDPINYCSVREKRWNNYDDRSTLDGIWVSVHEYGHMLRFSHLASGSYDPMNVTFRNEWTKHLYSPPHFNPIFKLQAGWITPEDAIKIKCDSSISLQPGNRSPVIAAYTIYGDALRNDDYAHSEYFIVEYRKREGFNRFSGGQDRSSFTGGALVWHYSQYGTFTFEPFSQKANIGLKVAGYCDAENYTDFRTNTGDPLHFYWGANNLINASTNPNTSSAEHLTTGITLSNFSISGDSITITSNYTLGAVPDYVNFCISENDTIPCIISGNTFIAGGQMPNNLTIIDRAKVEIKEGELIYDGGSSRLTSIYLDYLMANASSQNSISFRGIGFGDFRLPWNGIRLICNGAQRSSITNCLIADAAESTGMEIIITDEGLEPIFSNNLFHNCRNDLWLDGGMREPKEIGGYDNNSFKNVLIIGFWKLTNSKIFTVPSDATLYIWDADIQFDTGSSLYCKGKLITYDIPFNFPDYDRLITFNSTGAMYPGSWGSIVLDGPGASNSILRNIRMLYGTNIQVLNGASNVIIENCVIDSCNGAVLYNNSSGSMVNNQIFYTGDYPGINIQSGSSVTCNLNNLKKTNGDCLNIGICYSGGANGTLWQNDIGYFSWGLGAIWGSSPIFWNQIIDSDNRNNRITNCQNGVMIYQNSFPEIGNSSLPQFGVSTIENNNIDVALNTSYSTVSDLGAVNIYWNNGNPDHAKFQLGDGSSISTTPFSTTNYWSSIPLLSALTSGDLKGRNTPSIQPIKSSVLLPVQENAVADNPLIEGINLRLNENIVEAKDFFVSYLNQYPENQQAYVELYNCYSVNTAGEITGYFENLPALAAKEQELLLSYLYLKQGDVQKAREVNNRIISKYPGTPIVTMAKLGNFYITLYNESNPQTASIILDDAIENSYLSTSVELELALAALKIYVDPGTGGMPYANDNRGSGATEPTQFGLIGNYPNPFNQTTTIAYQLSEFTQVTLRVYDLIGREICSFMEGTKAGGRHTVIFDGTKFSSGVYFIRFIMKPQAGDQIVQVKKMLMIK